jgi:hypothetical protein
MAGVAVKARGCSLKLRIHRFESDSKIVKISKIFKQWCQIFWQKFDNVWELQDWQCSRKCFAKNCANRWTTQKYCQIFFTTIFDLCQILRGKKPSPDNPHCRTTTLSLIKSPSKENLCRPFSCNFQLKPWGNSHRLFSSETCWSFFLFFTQQSVSAGKANRIFRSGAACDFHWNDSFHQQFASDWNPPPSLL